MRKQGFISYTFSFHTTNKIILLVSAKKTLKSYLNPNSLMQSIIPLTIQLRSWQTLTQFTKNQLSSLIHGV
jgi:hypothetical protein